MVHGPRDRYFALGVEACSIGAGLIRGEKRLWTLRDRGCTLWYGAGCTKRGFLPRIGGRFGRERAPALGTVLAAVSLRTLCPLVESDHSENRVVAWKGREVA